MQLFDVIKSFRAEYTSASAALDDALNAVNDYYPQLGHSFAFRICHPSSSEGLLVSHFHSHSCPKSQVMPLL